MIIPTHGVIGEHIYRSVMLNTGFKLDRPALILGSVLPDMAPKYIRQKHFYEVSYDYMLLMVEDMRKNLMTMSPREFALRLGIITHYISDFFCLPHNDRAYFKTHVSEHMAYESKLHFEIGKYNYTNWMDIPQDEKADVKSAIDMIRSEYEKKPQGIENDIITTFYAVDLICSMLVLEMAGAITRLPIVA